MVQKRERKTGFVLNVVPVPSKVGSRSKQSCSQRHVITCAAVKLLVIDLQHMLRQSSPEAIKQFSERVEVDRQSAQDTTYVVYNSESGYSPSMSLLQKHELVEPDALSASDGVELYQRMYKTPDPYWANTVRRDWDPKPARWVVNQFFGDHLTDCHSEDSGALELVFQSKKDTIADSLVHGAQLKLSEMGIDARVKKNGDSNTILVVPAGASVSELVAFCQMMLRISEDSTYLFGSDSLLETSLRDRGNLAICAQDQQDLRGMFNGVFVSDKFGAEALMDGVLHYAIF